MIRDLETLWDLRAIEQVYYRYCEVIDQKDFDALIDVFTPDAIGDYRQANGILDQNLASLVARLHKNMGHDSYCGVTAHYVSNVRAEVTGDAATSKAQYYAVHAGRGPFEGQIYTCWGIYQDLWVRGPQGWRVRERLYTKVLDEGPGKMLRGVPS